jgi:hypothetical protein
MVYWGPNCLGHSWINADKADLLIQRKTYKPTVSCISAKCEKLGRHHLHIPLDFANMTIQTLHMLALASYLKQICTYP